MQNEQGHRFSGKKFHPGSLCQKLQTTFPDNKVSSRRLAGSLPPGMLFIFSGRYNSVTGRPEIGGQYAARLGNVYWTQENGRVIGQNQSWKLPQKCPSIERQLNFRFCGEKPDIPAL